MTIEKLVKYGKRTLVTGLASAMIFAAGCADDAPKKKNNPPVNQAPVVEITTNFGNGYNGNVEYCFNATDSDGTVSQIYASYNESGIDFVQNGECRTQPIVYGIPNNVSAYAEDDKGMVSETVYKEFTPATEAEARDIILGMIPADNGGIDFTTSPGQVEYLQNGPSGVYADFVIERPLGDSVVVEYIGEADNPIQEMNDKAYFEGQNIPYILMRGLPPEELTDRTNKFILDSWQ